MEYLLHSIVTEETPTYPRQIVIFPTYAARLGIEIINARSPQAKGRVERLNGVLQDRLVPELRRRGITGMEEANRYLTEEFLPKFNERCMQQEWNRVNAHTRAHHVGDYDMIFGKRVQRTVTHDYTIRYDTTTYQITKLRGEPLRVRSKAKIDVYQYLDKRIKMFYKGEELCIKEVAA